ncbi:MAG: DUF5329 family protein [Acidobacteriota bacterium]
MAVRSAPGAPRDPAEQAKIDRLLEMVRGSGATFIRNGKEYDAGRAVSHLKQKLFLAGGRVRTASEFVRGVASHSEASGRPYLLRLPGGEIRPLGDWLLEKLAAMETRAPSPTPSRTPRSP